jgi:hypothetical protein
VYPILYGADTTFGQPHLNPNDTADGLFLPTATSVTYVFKGETRTDTILARYLHLSTVNTDYAYGQTIGFGSQLGSSGNSGFWKGVSPYGPHLHFDIRTATDSPYLNSLMSSQSQRYYYAPQKTFYYDPFILLHEPDYSYSSQAMNYGK